MELISTGAASERDLGFSRAVVTDSGEVHVSGCSGLVRDGVTPPGTATEQFERALAKIAGVLDRAGCTLADVVMTRVYLVGDVWDELGRAHGAAFGEIRPACTMVEVARLIDPEMLVEVEALAVRPGR